MKSLVTLAMMLAAASAAFAQDAYPKPPDGPYPDAVVFLEKYIVEWHQASMNDRPQIDREAKRHWLSMTMVVTRIICSGENVGLLGHPPLHPDYRVSIGFLPHQSKMAEAVKVGQTVRATGLFVGGCASWPNGPTSRPAEVGMGLGNCLNCEIVDVEKSTTRPTSGPTSRVASEPSSSGKNQTTGA
jgi:hypothetical protein